MLAEFFQDFYVYDPATVCWTNVTVPASGTLPLARSEFGFASAGGKLYVHGGMLSWEKNGEYTHNTYNKAVGRSTRTANASYTTQRQGPLWRHGLQFVSE